jgi:hypothetical protein
VESKADARSKISHQLYSTLLWIIVTQDGNAFQESFVTPRLLGPLESEEEGNTVLGKTGNYLSFDTAYHPKKLGYPNTANCFMLGLIFTLQLPHAWRDFTAQQGHYKITRLYVTRGCVTVFLSERDGPRPFAQN